MFSFATKTYTINILRISLELSSLIDLSYKQTISPSFKNPLKGYQRPPVLSDFLAARNSLSPAPDFGHSPAGWMWYQQGALWPIGLLATQEMAPKLS